MGKEKTVENPVLTDTDLEEGVRLILFNDDYNTFDFVIECLQKICGINYVQAEQLTLLVHFKGKTIVKKGEPEELNSMCEKLVHKGLTAKVK